MHKALLPTLLLLLLFISVGCSRQEISPTLPSYPTDPTHLDIENVEFEETTVLLCEAPDSQLGGFTLRKTLSAAQRGNVRFLFESAIPSNEREACIETTEQILDRIGNSQPLQLCIFSSDAYNYTFIQDGTIYTHLQDWADPDYIAILIQGVLGEYCSYGGALGYANWLAQELFDSPAALWDTDRQFDGDSNILDLNLLCFRSSFFSGKDIKAAKKLANSFVTQQIQSQGEAAFLTLLRQSGTEEGSATFARELSDFYASCGIEYAPNTLRYRHGGAAYDYIARFADTSVYVETRWTDTYHEINPYTYEDFLHKNYADIRQYLTLHAEQMDQYQALFSLESEDLTILFSNTVTRSSCYLPDSHTVCLTNTAAFMVCYIRSLIYNHIPLENWTYVGMSSSFCHRYNLFGIAVSNLEFNDWEYTCFHEFRQHLGRDISIETDFPEIAHLYTYACNYTTPNDGGGYLAGASFILYLTSRLGEDAVLDILLRTHDFGEYSYESLVADWQEFLLSNYSGYTKIK